MPEVEVVEFMLPEVSTIKRIFAGTSALPVPGGGDFAPTPKEATNNTKSTTLFK
jgi:hypothetical protein